MTTAASDDLICRVRAYLAGLEPPVPADDLSDEEVTELVLGSLGSLQDWVILGSLPERFRSPKPPPPPKPKPPTTVEYIHGGRPVKSNMNSLPPQPFLRKLLDILTPSEPPLGPH
jgi:hypothetical protein